MNANSIAWSERLMLGIPSFDQEHEIFITSICRFIDKVDRGVGQVLVAPMLDRIVDTFRFHSASEEELLEAHDFAGLKGHAKEHRNLASLLDSLRMEFMVTTQAHEHLNIARMIGRTFIDHIDRHDRSYAEHLRDRGLV